MALNPLTDLEQMGSDNGTASLRAIIKEMRGLRFFVATGAAAVANITVTGISFEDTLLAVLRLNKDASAANIDLTDLTAEAQINVLPNIIRCLSTDTTGDKLLVIYYDKNY